MAFPDYATSVTQDFNESDKSPPTGWSNLDNSVRVVGNQFAGNAAGYCNGQYGTADWANFEAIMTVATLDFEFYFITRSGGGGNSYLFGINGTGTGYYITEYAGGSPTTLKSGSVTFSAGHKLGCKLDGSSLELWHYNGSSWTMLDSATDTTRSTGKVGFGCSFNAGRYDDWSVAQITTQSFIKTVQVRSRGVSW